MFLGHYKSFFYSAMLSLFLFCQPITSFATGAGFYWGLMLGPANNNAKSLQAQVSGTPTNPPTTTTVNPRSQQFGSRFFLGYMPSPYAGMELGLTYFSSIKYVSPTNTTLCGASDLRVRDVEFLAKAAYPFREFFTVFAKVGPAFAYQTEGGALNPSTTGCGQSSYTTKWVPAYAVGASYDITPNWVTDLSIHQVAVGGTASTMTMYAVGISYHFTDRYCGQFLC